MSPMALVTDMLWFMLLALLGIRTPDKNQESSNISTSISSF